MAFNTNMYNVIMTGIAFLLVFSAFSPASQTSQIVLESFRKHEASWFNGSGYISLAIVYLSFSVLNWIAPVVVLAIGQRYSMLLGALCYSSFIAVFFEPREWSLYLFSLVVGLGAALIWTAQGAFITNCSRDDNVNKNFSIFWALFQCSQLVGGVYSYSTLASIEDISRGLRLQLYGGLFGASILGTLFFLLLRRPVIATQNETTSLNVLQECGVARVVETAQEQHAAEVSSVGSDSSPPWLSQTDEHASPSTHFHSHGDPIEDKEGAPKIGGEQMNTILPSPWYTLKRTVTMLRSKILLSVLLATGFTGVNLTMYSSVYATCLGHTLQFGNHAKSYIGLAMLFIGIGEILGSILTHFCCRNYRDGLIAFVGYPVSLLAAYLMLLMLPDVSPLQDTYATAYINANVYLATFIALLLGLADSVWNTEISALIGRIYSSHSCDLPVAFALFKCIQSLVTAITFFYSTRLLLHWQLLIYAIWATLSFAGFLIGHWGFIASSH